MAATEELTHGHRLTRRRADRLLLAFTRETVGSYWPYEGLQRMVRVLDELPDGLLMVRRDYAGRFKESELTDAEWVDQAIDYYGL